MKVFTSRRALPAVLLALALPLGLVACGSDDGDAADGQAQESEATPTEGETTPAEAEAELLHVVAREYEYVGFPDAVPAGEYNIHLQNEGKEHHELALAEITTDTSVDDLLKLPQKELMKEIRPVGATFAPPGAASEQPFIAELEPGRYVAVCFIPVKEKKGNPPHAARGMVHEFTVE